MITKKPKIIHTAQGLHVEYDPLTPHFDNYFSFEERKQLEKERKEEDAKKGVKK